jgi:hypothetical protein
MTEDVKDAPVEDAPEAQEQPAPAMPSEGSPEESSAQPQDVSAIVEARVEEAISGLDTILDDKVDARFKSAKDKRYAKVEEIYDWVKEAGGDVSKIKTSLELADLREQLEAVQSGPSEDAGTSPPLDSGWKVAQAKTDIILKRAGIATDDPEYNVWVEKYRGDIPSEDWPGIVDTFVKGRRGGSPGAVVAEAGATAPVSADQESLSERLVAATKTGDYETVDRLQKELTEAMKS